MKIAQPTFTDCENCGSVDHNGYACPCACHGEVSDVDVMEANGAGMDSYSDGKSIHDNPYRQQDLRNAWHEGWRSAERHRGD